MAQFVKMVYGELGRLGYYIKYVYLQLLHYKKKIKNGTFRNIDLVKKMSKMLSRT